MHVVGQEEEGEMPLAQHTSRARRVSVAEKKHEIEIKRTDHPAPNLMEEIQ
jgi:hypothetical protein